jgi:HEAT repeat protein
MKNPSREERVRALALSLPVAGEEEKDAIRAELTELRATALIATDLGSPNEETRIRAAELLALVPGPDGVAPLIRALADPVARVRELSAAALWLCADPQAVEPLAKTLCDRDPDVRSAAAQSLGRLGGARAIEALEQAYQTEKDDFTRLLIGDSLAVSTRLS